ncbi:hypothetical protein OG613_26905 [Streptomyces sp. NBC_00015]
MMQAATDNRAGLWTTHRLWTTGEGRAAVEQPTARLLTGRS